MQGSVMVARSMQVPYKPAAIEFVNPGKTRDKAWPVRLQGAEPRRFRASLSQAKEVDLYALELVAGQTLHYMVEDTWKSDNALRARVNLFMIGRDQGVGRDHQNHKRPLLLEFKVKFTGTYYLGISAASNGNYNIANGKGAIGPKYNSKGAYTLTIWTTGNPVYGAVPPSTLSLSEKGQLQLKDYEGYSLVPYFDLTSGKAATYYAANVTIGWGHVIFPSEWNGYKNGITAAQAQAIFDADVDMAEAAVRNQVNTNLTQNQFDALVIMAFNIGYGNFGKSKVRTILNTEGAQPTESLRTEWLDFNRDSSGQINDGLTNRRHAEWDIFSNSDYHGLRNVSH